MVAQWCTTNWYLKLFSYKGALLKHHLDGGIRKGALTQERWCKISWLEAKAGVDAKKEGLTKAQVAEKLKLSKQSKKLMLNV
jgi:small subunit ribosomal protein S16